MRITACNKAFADLLGYSVEELVGMHATEITLQTDISPQEVAEYNGQLEIDGGTQLINKVFIHQNGAHVKAQVQVYLTRNEQGEPDGAWALIRDTTDVQYRIQSLNTLIRIANAVNETHDMRELAANIRSELGSVIDTTNFYIALYDSISKSFSLPFLADTKDRIQIFPAKRTLTGYVIDTETPLMADRNQIQEMADNDLIDIVGTLPEMWLGAPLKHQGKLLGVVAVQSYSPDVLYTKNDLDLLCFVSNQIAMAIQKRQAEEELRTSEDRLRTTIDGLNDIVHVVDSNMRLVLVNQAMRAKAREMGYAGELLGADLFDVFSFLPGNLRELYQRVFATGQTIRTEDKYELEDRSVWTRVRRFPIIDSYGNVRHVLTVVQDVTEQHEAERTLMHAQKMEAMGALAGGIAHDFNNILSVILGYSEMAHLESQKPNVKRAVKEITQAGKRAKELVSQILAFSRQEEESMQPVNVGQITREVLRMLRASLPSTIQIKRNVTSTRYVYSDPTRLHQVIMNLCTNAFHAMQPDGGVLTVEVEDIPGADLPKTLRIAETPGFIRLRVSDTGRGIPPEIRERIFEPYFTTKSKGHGTGLGLAIINSIVTALDGEIHVDSVVGEGTTFTVFLPVTEAVVQDQASDENENQATTHARILFVDDEPTIVSLSRVALHRYGYEVQGFTNSSKALEEFEQRPFAYDLVITDLTMPRPTGLEMVKKMRKIRPDIPVILCTGYNELINEEKMKQHKIDHILFKPIPASAYIAVIEEIRGAQNAEE